MLEAEFIPHYIKLTPVVLSNLGAISAFILYKNFSTELYLMKKTNLAVNPSRKFILTEKLDK